MGSLACRAPSATRKNEQLKAARQSAKSLTDVQWQLSSVGKSVNTSTKESLLSIGKVLSQLGTSVEKQGKSMDKTNSLLETLCSTMKTLVDVEQRKSTLVAQATHGGQSCIFGRDNEFDSQFTCQLACRISSGWLCGGYAGRRSDWWCGIAPSYTWNRDGCAATSSEIDADQFEPGSTDRVPATAIVPTSGICPGCLYDAGHAVFIRMLSGSGGPQPPFWKRVRLSDGSWAWAEQDHGDN